MGYLLAKREWNIQCGRYFVNNLLYFYNISLTPRLVVR
jgi:hypothetical protein